MIDNSKTNLPRKENHNQCMLRKKSKKLDTNEYRLAPVRKTNFHQCVISHTCSQSNSDGSVLSRAIRVRLATSICYDTLMKNCLRTGASLKFSLLRLPLAMTRVRAEGGWVGVGWLC